jgi:hypothetical protein
MTRHGEQYPPGSKARGANQGPGREEKAADEAASEAAAAA